MGNDRSNTTNSPIVDSIVNQVKGGSTSKPGVSGTPTPEQRTERQAGIHSLSTNRLQVALAKGEITEQEIIEVFGPNKLVEVKNDPLTPANIAAINSPNPSVSLPPAPVAPPPPEPRAAAAYNQLTRGFDGPSPTSAVAAYNQLTQGFDNPVTGGSNEVGPGGRTLSQVKGTDYVNDAERAWYLSKTGASAPKASSSSTARSSGGSSGSGGGGSSAAASPASPVAPPPPPPPPVNPLSAQGLLERGGIPVNGRISLNGQQYLNTATQKQGPDGLWYNVGQDGQPIGAGFKTQTAARLAETYQNGGASITSRLGNSPAAKASAQGGYNKIFAPGESNFNTLSLDQLAAAGGTKGTQVGDIAGTISNGGKNFYDITYGGIPEGGGLTTVGNAASPLESFTGQVPGNTAIGMSSILGNSGHDTQYWLQQMSGLTPSELAKLNIDTPEKALQFQQVIETARAQGRPYDFGPLYANNEANIASTSNRSNTPYDRELNAFKGQLGPDLTYFPDANPVQNGATTQINGTAYGPEAFYDPNRDGPDFYAKGGQMMTRGPVAMVDMSTGKTEAIAGEAGPERITVDPMKDVKKSSEGGWGKPMMMAKGGDIYTGGKTGFGPSASQPLQDPTGTVTDYGSKLGYSSDPFIQGTGGGTIYNGGGNAFNSPAIPKSGQPAPASYEFMDPDTRQKFVSQNNAMPGREISGPLGAQSVGTQQYGNYTLPVYDQLNQQVYSNPYTNTGDTTGYDYVPYNLGGTPVLVRVPKYGNMPAPLGRDERTARDTAYLMAALNGGDTANMGLGNLSYSQIGDTSNRGNVLNQLYRTNPEAWAQAISSGAAGQNGQNGNGQGGGWGGPMQDRNIENEAYRRRQYDIQARNYSRAGLPSPTLLDIPRDPNYTGDGEAPYQRYGRQVQNGFALPFDYNQNSPWYNRDNSQGGGWGRGFGGGSWGGQTSGGGQGGQGGGQNNGGGWPGNGPHTPEPWGGRPQLPRPPGNPSQDQWFNQLPWWARGARRFGPPVGTGMTGGA